MDHFHEEVVVKRKKGLDEFTYWLSWLVLIFSGAACVYLLSFMTIYFRNGDWLSWVLMLVVFGGIGVLTWIYHDRLRPEYEYTFTNGALDFAQVFNNKKRKTLGSLNVKTIDVFGPVNGEAFKRYVSMPEVQQTRWFLNREGNLHFFYFQKEGSKRIIVFEPSEELVDLIRKYLPHGAYQQ